MVSPLFPHPSLAMREPDKWEGAKITAAAVPVNLGLVPESITAKRRRLRHSRAGRGRTESRQPAWASLWLAPQLSLALSSALQEPALHPRNAGEPTSSGHGGRETSWGRGHSLDPDVGPPHAGGATWTRCCRVPTPRAAARLA